MKSDGYSVDAVPVAECTPCHIGCVVDCAYDHKSRRIGKHPYAWDGATWQPAAPQHYTYDGWNMTAGGLTLISPKCPNSPTPQGNL